MPQLDPTLLHELLDSREKQEQLQRYAAAIPVASRPQRPSSYRSDTSQSSRTSTMTSQSRPRTLTRASFVDNSPYAATMRLPRNAPSRRSRPTSAVHRNNGASSQSLRRSVRARPTSAPLETSRRAEAAARRMYQARPHLVRCVAHKNGTYQHGIRVQGDTLHALLRACTQRLDLPFAARRLFDESGQELLSTEDCQLLEPHAIVYVSLGEPFADPFARVAAEHRRRLGPTASLSASVGLSSGLHGRTANSRPLSAGRCTASIDQAGRLRATFFNLGEGINGTALLLPDSLDDVLHACTRRLALSGPAARLFALDGHVIREATGDLHALCHPALQYVIGRVAGPFWVVAGTEAFDTRGPLAFIQHHVQRLDARIKQCEQRKEILDSIISGYEAQEAALGDLDLQTNRLQESRRYLLACRATLLESVADGPEPPLAASIPRLKPNSTLVDARPALYLAAVPNGLPARPENSRTFTFHVGEAERRAQDAQGVFALLLARIDSLLDLGGPAKRLFDKSGRELRKVHQLRKVNTVWVSRGEPFVPYEDVVLGVSLSGARQVLVRAPTASDTETPTPETSESSNSPHPMFVEHFDVVEDDELNANNFALLAADEPVPEALKYDAKTVGTEALERLKPLAHSTAMLLLRREREVAVFQPRVAFHLRQLADKSNLLQRWQVQPLRTATEGPTLCFISSRLCPSMVLTVLGDPAADSPASPLPVGFGEAAASNLNALWFFADDGTIRTAANAEFGLTLSATVDVALKHADENTSMGFSSTNNDHGQTQRGEQDEDSDGNGSPPTSGGVAWTADDAVGADGSSADHVVLSVQAVEAPATAVGQRQRWAFKSYRFDQVALFKESRDVNQDRRWIEKALMWPCDANCQWNAEMPAPLEALLVGKAPWPTQRSSARFDRHLYHRKLKVVPNVNPGAEPSSVVLPLSAGERGRSNTVGNAMAPATLASSLPKDTRHWLSKKLGTDWAVSMTDSLTQQRDERQEWRLELLLVKCDAALPQLTGASRQLFTPWGAAVTDPETFDSAVVLQVSCGEPWHPGPAVTRATKLLEGEIRALRQVAEAYAAADSIATFAQRNGSTFTTTTDEEAALQAVLKPQRQLMVGDDCLTAIEVAAGATITLEPLALNEPGQKWIVEDGLFVSAMDANLCLGWARREARAEAAAGEDFDGEARLCLLDRNTNRMSLVRAVKDRATFRLQLPGASLPGLLQQAGVCSAAFHGAQAVDQLAYLDARDNLICPACAENSGHNGSSSTHSLSLGVQSFVCSNRNRALEIESRFGLRGPKGVFAPPQPVPLGARVTLRSVEDAEEALARWDRYLGRLVGVLDRRTVHIKPSAPTSSLEPSRRLKTVLYKNGEVLKTRSKRVVVVLESDERSLAFLLSEATRLLNLANAARALFLRDGTPVERLSSLGKKHVSDANDLELWVSCGEPFVRPETCFDALRQERQELRGAFARCKEEAQALKSQRKNLKALMAKEATESTGRRLDTLQTELDSNKLDLEAVAERMTQFKARLRQIDLAVHEAGRPKIAKASQPRDPDLFQRLAKPVRPMARVLARRNGAWDAPPLLCMARSLEDLLVDCTEKLRMNPVRRLYTLQGQLVHSLEELATNQEVLASAGEPFVGGKSSTSTAKPPVADSGVGDSEAMSVIDE